mgnify:CR=1 FL=1
MMQNFSETIMAVGSSPPDFLLEPESYRASLNRAGSDQDLQRRVWNRLQSKPHNSDAQQRDR